MKDFGAVATAYGRPAAIQAAIDYASSLGGGFVDFPAGTFLIGSTLLLPSKVILRGQGRAGTVIKVANGVNLTAIKTDNFDTNTGHNYWNADEDGAAIENVRYGFGLLHLSIDGNRTNNTSAGSGVQFFGKNYTVSDVLIRSCRDRGFYSETGSKGGQPNGYVDLPECYIGPIWVQDSGDQAFRFDGPHDATITWLIAAGAGQNYGAGLGPPAVEFGGTATSSGACDISFLHQYAGTGIGLKFGTSHIFADHIQAETNHLEGVVALGDINHINFIRAFNNNRGGTAGQYYNIRLGQNVHVGIAQATCSNNAGGIEIGVYLRRPGDGGRLQRCRRDRDQPQRRWSYVGGAGWDLSGSGSIGVTSFPRGAV